LNEKIYTGGTFDLFHQGHVRFLQGARSLGDYLVVALNDDQFVEQFKRRPICSYQERYEVLKSCKYVDEVIKNWGGGNSGPAIDMVAPDFIVIGDDWKDRDYLGQLGIDQEFLDDRNIEIIYLQYTAGISTTEIIRRVTERDHY
jgi:glycerol-3-phosphate cytidylyltransferase